MYVHVCTCTVCIMCVGVCVCLCVCVFMYSIYLNACMYMILMYVYACIQYMNVCSYIEFYRFCCIIILCLIHFERVYLACLCTLRKRWFVM